MNVFESIEELVGGTPLLRLNRFSRALGLKTPIVAKLESLNPTGSAKDRAALFMIADAERRGLLKEGSTIVEPTSGNTGIGLAAFGTARGYRVVLTMPETMSSERRKLLQYYGAQIVLTDGKLGMQGAIARAEEIAAATPDAFLIGQFCNPANPEAHYKTTGPEIYAALEGKVDFFVAGVGTGGTITGVGRYLKERVPAVTVVAAEPQGSPVLSGGSAGSHGIQGIGAGFVPENFDRGAVDEIVPVSDKDALKYARLLCRTEGYFVGISAGAALWAGACIAKRPENRFRTTVVLLPDSGDRYLSTALFEEEL